MSQPLESNHQEIGEMQLSTLRVVFVLTAVLASTLAGCSGGGTTQDTAPTSPPITSESLKSNIDEINAAQGGIKNAPGVKKK